MSPPVKANTGNFTAPPSVASQMARLPELPMPEIKALWQRLFGDDTPTHNRQFLERRIAYRLQEVEFRKTDGNLLERNKRRIASLVETGKVKKRDRDHRPAAGTVLTRDYQGVEHPVIVSPRAPARGTRRPPAPTARPRPAMPTWPAPSARPTLGRRAMRWTTAASPPSTPRSSQGL